MKGLIIKSDWADKILSGKKTMELRSSNTNIRGTVGVIKSGTGRVWGTIDIIDSIELSDDDYYRLKDKHCVKYKRDEISYKKIYGWVIENPVKYNDGIPYNHKQGCVIWVNL